MAEDRVRKQNFLRAEIIEKLFSPDDFNEYCEKLKGADIDIYTFEELEEIVHAFQKESKKNSEEPEVAVPETYVEVPKRHSRSPERRVEREEDKSKPYLVQGIKMHDNALSLEEVITVSLGQ
jgi:hypothetical protein